MSVYVHTHILGPPRRTLSPSKMADAVTALYDHGLLEGGIYCIAGEHTPEVRDAIRYPLNLRWQAARDKRHRKGLGLPEGLRVVAKNVVPSAIPEIVAAASDSDLVFSFGELAGDSLAELDRQGSYNGEVFMMILARRISLHIATDKSEYDSIRARRYFTMIGNGCPNNLVMPKLSFYQVLAGCLPEPLRLLSHYS